jgi:mRNA interferase MazF
MNGMAYGDILFADLDPAFGHEQKKRRPVIVVSNAEFNRRNKLTMVVPVSRTDNGYPLHAQVRPVPVIGTGEMSAGKIEGFAQVEQMKSLDLTYRNAVKVGEADPRDLQRITELLVGCIIQPDLLVVSSN